MPYAGSRFDLVAPGAGEVTRLPVVLLDDDGAPVTGEAFDAAGMDVEYAKPGGTFADFPTFDTNNWHEVGRGVYEVIVRGDDLTEAALLDTEGMFLLYVATTASSAKTALHAYKVSTADVVREGDEVTLAADQEVNVTKIGGNAQSLADLKDFADTGYDPTTHKVAGVVLVDTTTANTDMRGTDDALTAADVEQAPTNFSSLGITAEGRVDVGAVGGTTVTDPDDLKADVSNLDAAVSSRSSHSAADVAALLNNLSSADAQAAAESALAAYDAATGTDVTAATSGLSTFDPATAEVDVGAVKGAAVTGVDDFKATGFSTHSAADAASAVWGAGSRTLTGFGTLVADIATAVWSAAARTLTAFGFTAGANVTQVGGQSVSGPDDLKADVSALALEATVGALNNLSSADAEAAATAALNAYDPPTKAELDTAVSPLALEATLTAIKGAGWTDETLAAIKAAVDAIGSGGDATAANQTTIIGHLTDIKGVTWSTETLVALKALLDALPTLEQMQSGISTFDPALDEVNVGAVKGTAVTGVTDFRADISGLATSAELALLNDLSASDIQSIVDALQTHGDAEWSTADLSGISTLTELQVQTIVDGLNNLSESDVQVLITALQNHGDSAWSTADTSGLSTFNPSTDGVLLSESSQESLVSAVWSATERTITTFGTIVSDIVTAIWGAAERTITGGSVDAVGGQDLSNLDAPVSLVPGAVWDELQAEHSIEGSTAESLASAASGVVDESAIAAAVWSYVDRVITGGTVDIADSLIDALDEIKSTTVGEYDRDLHSLEALRAKLDAITGTGTNTVEAVLSYGEGVAANHISVYVTDLAGNRVAGPKTSDQNGVAEFLIDDGDYLLVVSDSAYLSGGTFPFTVSGSGEHQFALTPITISDPPNGNYCVVYGFAEDLKGDDQTGYAKVVRVHGPEYREVAGEYVDVVYNKEYTTELSDGRWELVVLHGAEVDIKVVYGGGEQKTRRNLAIPSSAQANWRSISEG